LGGAPPTRTLGPQDFLKNRAFQLFQARGTLSSVSYTLYLGTILWLTYRLSGGILLAGILLGVQTVVFTLTFLIGPVVDRVYDKRWVFVVCYPFQAALAAVLGIAYAFGALSLPLLFAIVVLLAILWDFTEAADETTTRLLFGKDHLFLVSGLGSAIGGGVGIAIYFTAGAAIALFGVVGGTSLFAAILVVATVLALPLPIPTPRILRQSWWSGFREGWGLFRGENGRPLRHLALLQLAVGFFVPAPLLLLTLYVGRFFAGAQATYAGLYVAYLVGGILLGLILGHTNPRGLVGPLTIGGMFVTGLILLGAEFAVGSLLLSLGVWFVVGVVTTTRQGTWIYLQGRHEPELLARVTMNIYLFMGAASAIGAFTIGVLSTTWSPEALTDLTALGFVGSATLGILLPGTRKLKF
jgi:hypothetical protein